MKPTMITNPTLVVDLSMWDPIVKPQELLDGGVTDVILKIGAGCTGEDPLFRKNGQILAKFSPLMRLHGYWWDDPIYSSDNQVNNCLQIVKSSGLPILSIWADQEQWWGDWGKYLDAKKGKIPWKEVPVLPAAALDRHYHNFANVLNAAFPNSGIYICRGFITTYAPNMKYWLGFFKIWLAQYGYQPAKATSMTWKEFKANWLPNYDPNIRDTGIKPENLVGHQFTGDTCLLPGSYQNIFGRRTPMDVSVFKSEFMENLAGGSHPKPPEPVTSPDPTIQEYIFLGAHLWVRSTPDANGKLVDSLTKSQRVNVLEVQGKWARIEKPAGWVEMAWLTKV